MLLTFRDQGAQDIFNGVNSKAARSALGQDLWAVAKRKLDMLAAATEDKDLRAPPSNHFEKLAGDLAGWHSIRINDRYRVVFRWAPPNASEVYFDDYH